MHIYTSNRKTNLQIRAKANDLCFSHKEDCDTLSNKKNLQHYLNNKAYSTPTIVDTQSFQSSKEIEVSNLLTS